jgi:hypothetical protein
MLSNYMLSVPCCDFCIKACLISFFSCLFCRWFMSYLCYLYLFMYTGVQHDFHIRWCSCPPTLTWRVPLVEQELLALSAALSSPVSWVAFLLLNEQSLVFCVVFVDHWLTCCRFLFLLAIVLPVDLRLPVTPLVSSIFSSK